MAAFFFPHIKRLNCPAFCYALDAIYLPIYLLGKCHFEAQFKRKPSKKRNSGKTNLQRPKQIESE